ncbi:hypothetical protein Pfo_029731 [Paulownia fortunei]|nr:hypothetical protein Pfo_029731 [Paulownia fortunei]
MAFPKPRRLMMLADSFYIPKDNPSKPRGEDAHFFCEEAQVIGVADGVGGWARKGIDAGEYARELMRNAADAVRDCGPTDVDPKQVLVEAFLNTKAQGSSTACIISLAGDLLRAANLGDSGFLVIRGGKTLYRSPVQQYSFNVPYQMGNSTSASPEEAEEMVVEVEGGDVIIAGTDGLFDNLFPEDIEATVELWARRQSLDKTSATPFEVAAYEAGVMHVGGKYDDITVVSAYVV